MFIKTEDKRNKVINLNNVSNIHIDEGNEGKIIFNMNYSVKIFGNKVTPDYVYWEFNSEEEKSKMTEQFLPYLTNLGWIAPFEEGQRYVNSNCISSIGFDDYKNRVIFNLNYNVTHPKDDRKLTSDFVFFNFSTNKKYNDFVDAMLGNRTEEEIKQGEAA
jgi:hypothetical protein